LKEDSTTLYDLCLSALASQDERERISICLSQVDSEGNEVRSFILNGSVPRYSASLVKVFWAVQALYDLELNEYLAEEIRNMLIHSSDKAGQNVVDLLINPQPLSTELNDEIEFENCYQERLKLEHFWEIRGFTALKAAHKTFLHEYDKVDQWIKLNKSANSLTACEMTLFWQKAWQANSQVNGLFKSTQTRNFFFDCLKRTPRRINFKPEDKDFQSSLIAFNLPESSTVFGKSGWLNEVINDSVLLPLPNGGFVTLTIMCAIGEARGINYIRDIGAQLLNNLMQNK